MGKNSPSSNYHKSLVTLARIVQYRMYGPLIGPKEKHQPNPRWDKNTTIAPYNQTGYQTRKD